MRWQFARGRRLEEPEAKLFWQVPEQKVLIILPDR